MEEVTRLVSTGDSVKIWDTVSMIQLEQFNPHSSSHPVARACWSSNNQYLLTSSSSGDKLVLSSLKSSAVPVVELADGKHQTCVCLSSSSQFVVSGGLDHCVHIWDLKTKRLLRSLKDHTDDITCVTFSANDSCVASSSVSGDVVLHSMTTHLSSKPLTPSNASSVQDIRFSPLKRSLLGSSSMSGTVVLWDSNTQKALHMFESAHKAPSCSLAFSPTSDLLVVSVGLDKRVVCYDTSSRIVLRAIRVDGPLTAVDFTPDGTGLVVGTTLGSICQYDLRNTSAPTSVTLAHKTSITCLRFQNSPRHKSSKPAPTKISSIKRSSSKTSSNQPELARSPGSAPNRLLTSTAGGVTTEILSRQAEGQPGAEFPVGRVGRSSFDMFSPVREGLTSDPRDATVNVYKQPSLNCDSSPSLLIGPDPRNSSGDTPVGRAHGTTVTSVEVMSRDGEGLQLTGRGSLDIFSPARDEVHSRGPLGTPLVAGRSYTPTPVFPSPLTIREEEPSGAKEAADSGKSNKVSRSGQEDDKTPPSTSQQTNHSQLAPPFFTPEPGLRRANGISAQEAPPTASAGPSVMAAVSSSLSHNIADVVEQGAAAPMTPLQIHFIQNMIHQTLEEFREECHKDVINLQVEMIRQFYIQLQEIHGLLERYSVNESLVEEIERLKEENRQLRANY